MIYPCHPKPRYLVPPITIHRTLTVHNPDPFPLLTIHPYPNSISSNISHTDNPTLYSESWFSTPDFFGGMGGLFLVPPNKKGGGGGNVYIPSHPIKTYVSGDFPAFLVRLGRLTMAMYANRLLTHEWGLMTPKYIHPGSLSSPF